MEIIDEIKKTKQRLTRSFALPFILLIFVALFFLKRTSELLELSKWVSQSEKVVAQINEQQKLLLDLETSVRGYLLTRDPSFLEPYSSALNTQTIQLKNISSMIESDPEQMARIKLLETLSANWVNNAKRDIGISAAVNYSTMKERKAFMDKMRGIIQEMIIREENLIRIKRETVESASLNSIRFLICSLIIVGFCLAFFTRKLISLVSRNYETALSQGEESRLLLKEANASLQARVQERTTAFMASNAQLEAANKELEAFCYSVSHDLRAPLRGIDGFSLALLEDYSHSIDNMGKRYLHFIREGVQKMGNLIDDLLELSRLTRADLKREKVDLSARAREIAVDLKQRFSDKVSFSADESLVVEGDEGLLTAALENLLSNAWKFSSKNERPEVSFGCSERDGKRIYFVKDNGAGFDMAYYQKLFGAFQRLHSRAEFDGIGVGLAIVKRVIHRHGGSIWAESTVGKGATFYFTL